MKYLGADGPKVNSTNVKKGITTLAMNINLNYYLETLKMEHYKHYKHFTTKLLAECHASKKSKIY